MLRLLAVVPSADHPVRGSCLCGAVSYEITTPFERAGYCHCARCRKLTGGLAGLNGRVPAGGLRLLSGGDALGSYTPRRRLAGRVLPDLRVDPRPRSMARRSSHRRASGNTRRRPRNPAAVPHLRRLAGALGGASRRRSAAVPRAPTLTHVAIARFSRALPTKAAMRLERARALTRQTETRLRIGLAG